MFEPHGHCTHLASHILGRLSEDFEGRYGYRLWGVETYVDPRWAFQRRQFSTHRLRNEVPKFMCELDPQWRDALGVKLQPNGDPP